MNKDQRRYPRYPSNIVLEISDYAKPSRKASALVTDISESGLCFETNQELELGSSLTLRLEVPMTIQGGVVYASSRGNKQRYGLRFHNVRFEPQRRQVTHSRKMIRMPVIPPVKAS
ncbi:MAG: PilZ domain-containing protein [Elusimicrobiota bacterium]